MRRLALLVLIAVPLSSGVALADNDVGCGVGTTLMAGRSGLVSHVLASWTNGSTGNSVSLTFNSFGCDSTGEVTADAQLRKFAAANIDQLAHDVARGEGEALAAFAHLLGVQGSQAEVFGAFTQAHFETLFPSADVDSNQMIDAFYGLLQG
ncbi:MAG: DUF3015 family protein [Deltaproteobacteria bacterium]|nr:DUF3015 family protein [Deltaproteobacteria bacterium]MBW2395722.1 DUF3015 family protein [Deltaproteobacteria bacterium]